MTDDLQRWLNVALHDLTPAIRARLEAEYRSHAADVLQTGGTHAEAVASLGPPDVIAKELKRLYLTSAAWSDLQTGGKLRTGLNLSEWLAALFWPIFLARSLIEPRVSLHGDWLAQLMLLISSTAMLLLTQQLHPLRRREWRLWAMMMSGLAFQWPYFTEVLLGGRDWLAWPLLALFVTRVATLQLRRDARLTRTLALEGKRA